MSQLKGMNQHQKAAHRPGEKKVSRAEVERDLETPITSSSGTRPALVCRRCARGG